MAKRAGAYKSEKRKKELLRLKKQEEKRQKRFKKEAESEHDAGHDAGTADKQEDVS